MVVRGGGLILLQALAPMLLVAMVMAGWFAPQSPDDGDDGMRIG